MKTIARVLAGTAATLAATAAFAQMPVYQEPPSQQAAYQDRAPLPQQELAQILAPVALYPDSLLSQLLMAATYPRDVAEAARWSRQNPALPGDEAVRAVEMEQWDPSVKSLVAFPEILAMMGDRPDWTQRLGEAFLANEGAVMQAVQDLRRRADEAGNLRSSEQLAVERRGEDYVLAPPSPEVTYVPYYDPREVYGAWAYPDYQPVYWNPWPGYAYYGGFGFGWGPGIYLSRGFYYGGFDWGRRHVRYSGHRPYYYRSNNYWRGWRDHRSDGRRYSSDHRGDGRGSWNDRRGDGRRDSNDQRRDWQNRSPGTQPRYERRDGPQRADGVQRVDGAQRADGARRIDGNTRRFEPSMRTAAPRYNVDGARAGGTRAYVERSAPVQRAAPIQQRSARVQPAAPQSAAPMQGNGLARSPASAPRAAQPVQRASQPSQRSGGGDRGADRGGGREGGGREGGGGNRGGGRER